jgi:ribonuclease E
LIDAAHAEETRVVVVDGNRIEELDFESQSRKQLRGNIYLAKVTRVEPSLQAAFVEYGGNRHGFLAFNEIHPDYYQIPTADREALMREEAEEEDEAPTPSRKRAAAAASEGDDEDEAQVLDDEDDVMEEELERRRRRLMRRYKIQEVIRRRQIMLIQVVKEERGNKGAALTTYLSLAGRYCVLMPNTARGGGISRKITNAADRKRLKTAAQSLDVPNGMGLIIRTAGAARTKTEIKRDYEYLLRLWESIREKTLSSIAPALIYEEEDLVKRAIRDLFDKDLDGIVVEGEPGYREAREFMRMIMPSQAKKIVQHKEPTPLFVRYKVEDQLAQLHSPVVPLRSGGYLVINQTEALVAIDVNSGKATRERNIEATALKTNLEAAEEAARQMRLRDLAGLIVIDFIDMDEGKNNRAVEKKLKDCLKDDRARLQMGKISIFGLMEISRQRRRAGVLEGSTHVCEHCQGTGRLRSIESSALAALRAVEMEAVRHGAGAATLRVPVAVGLYVLNEKRAYLLRLEQTQGLHVTVALDDTLSRAEHLIERTLRDETYRPPALPELVFESSPEPEIEVEEDEAEDEDVAEAAASDSEGDGGRRGRRRRRRGGRRDEGFERPAQVEAVGEDEDDDEEEEGGFAGGRDREDGDGRGRRRRRRGRRGGRRIREDGAPTRDPYVWRYPLPAERASAGLDPYAWYDPNDRRPPAPLPTVKVDVLPVVTPVSAAPLVAKPEGGEGEGRGRRRRSRGRRGRGEAPAAANDVYAWSEPDTAAPDAEVEADAVAAPAPEPETVAAAVEPAVEAVAEDAPAAKPKRVRAPRVRKTKAAAEAEAAAEPAPEASAEPAAQVVIERPTPEPAPATVEQAPALVEAAPVELVSAEPDPAEIIAPPAAPKRGWWRR